MIKLSKHLVLFLTLFTFLSFILIVPIAKFLPLTLAHAIYFCQSFLHAFSLPISSYVGHLLIGIPCLLLFTALAKILLIYIKTYRLREKLALNIHSQQGIIHILQKHKLQNKTYVIQSTTPFAYCFGIRYPKIYVSTAMITIMSEHELETILLHERYHLSHKDTLTMLLATTAQSLFPFFPLITDILRNFRIEREVQADAEAIREIGEHTPLISVLKKLLAFDSPAVAFAQSIADYDTLEARIHALVKKDYHFKTFKLFNIFISILSVGILMAGVIIPVQAIEVHEENNDMMMLCMLGDQCMSWCKENNTVKPYSKATNASYPYTPVSNRDLILDK